MDTIEDGDTSLEVSSNLDLEELCKNELTFIENCLKVNYKSYGTWHHRYWLIEFMNEPNLQREIQLCNQFLQMDERNCTFGYWCFTFDRGAISLLSFHKFTVGTIGASSWSSQILALLKSSVFLKIKSTTTFPTSALGTIEVRFWNHCIQMATTILKFSQILTMITTEFRRQSTLTHQISLSGCICVGSFRSFLGDLNHSLGKCICPLLWFSGRHLPGHPMYPLLRPMSTWWQLNCLITCPKRQSYPWPSIKRPFNLVTGRPPMTLSGSVALYLMLHLKTEPAIHLILLGLLRETPKRQIFLASRSSMSSQVMHPTMPALRTKPVLVVMPSPESTRRSTSHCEIYLTWNLTTNVRTLCFLWVFCQFLNTIL